MKAWIARDKDGTLGLYKHSEKPSKWRDWWMGIFLPNGFQESDLPSNINPQWEDDEPIEVELIIRRKGK